jgi:L-ascorbate metabolism protein UlaG (beta-lactamase superfamily)
MRFVKRRCAREVRIFWLGQNSFVFKTPENKLIALDIYLSRDPGLRYLYPDPPVRPEDAVIFAKLLSPEVVIPCHYNLWSGDTIDPEDFAKLFKSTSIRPFVIPYKGSNTYKAHP